LIRADGTFSPFGTWTLRMRPGAAGVLALAVLAGRS
jgi:hypothetical protein